MCIIDKKDTWIFAIYARVIHNQRDSVKFPYLQHEITRQIAPADTDTLNSLLQDWGIFQFTNLPLCYNSYKNNK